MEPYDAKLIPEAFGFNNTGVICYFNSFLQTLVGCSAFTTSVLSNSDYLKCTTTGTAVLDFVTSYVVDSISINRSDKMAFKSSMVLKALVSDLAARRPNVRFGGGQESASEALIHLLDMIEPPRAVGQNPITNLFKHRFSCELHCDNCNNKIVSSTIDYAVNFNLFDEKMFEQQDVASFSKAICSHKSKTEDYLCPSCLKKTTAIRVYDLIMIPEIIFCMFNLYGEVRRARYFPETLEFPAIKGGKLIYKIVGQIEHAGSLSGGHYWAHGLRAGDRVYRLNDTSVSLSAFVPSANTYIVVYHFVNTIH